jgi:uncharacterized protein (DUF4415 family)
MTANKRASERNSQQVKARATKPLAKRGAKLLAIDEVSRKLAYGPRKKKTLAVEAAVEATLDALRKQLSAKEPAWVDPDDAPEWTQEQFERADLYHGDKLIRRGRPPSDNPKQALKLRIDADVVEHFRATGPGWQTRINDTLRRAAKLRKAG